jgi:hypothetical protein
VGFERLKLFERLERLRLELARKEQTALRFVLPKKSEHFLRRDLPYDFSGLYVIDPNDTAPGRIIHGKL